MLLNAKPQSLDIDPKRTAVIVVDMQNDFGSKGGMFDLGGLDIACIQNVVPTISNALAAARRAGVRVVYLKMGYRPDLADLGPEGSPNLIRHQVMRVGQTVPAPSGSPSRILVRDQWGTAIVDELKPRPEDIVVWKTRYSGFYQTGLDEILKRMNARYLIFTGCTTSVCVESTIRDATFRDYVPALLTDCAAEPLGSANHQATIRVIEQLFGWTSSSVEFIQALESRAGRSHKTAAS